MAGVWTSERFPQFEAGIHRLTEEHRELKDEPLHLAIAYLPAVRDQQHIFLLEVIGGSVTTINPERDLFEVTFLSSSGFPMGPNEQLHLVLTNEVELRMALKQSWPLAREIVLAIRADDYRIMFADEIGEALLSELRDAARP